MILLASTGAPALPGSELQARYGSVSGSPHGFDFAAEAALVTLVFEAAPRCTLTHDVSDGGLGVALAEAALYSELGARLVLPLDATTLFGEGCGQVILAFPADRLGTDPLGSDARVRVIGEVGGDEVLGVPLDRSALRLGARGLVMCGVFGIRSVDRDVARLTYFALFALQHRGQESAGIAVSEAGRLTVLRDMGLVAQVFNEQQLQALPGEVAIGHTRYSTTGGVHWSNAQPLVHHGRARTVALGHNGNLTNAGALRAELVADGIRLGSTSDTEVIAALIARDPAPLAEAVGATMGRLEGAYSVVALVDDTLVAFRDPHGVRPLTLGRIDDDWVVASESCALDLIGATVIATSAR